MASSRIASRYSKSLYDLAKQGEELSSVKNDMDTVADVCSGSKDLINLLRNPIVTTKDKQAVLAKVFSSCSPTTLNFISYLVGKKREAELPMIADQFISSYDEMKGISRATVVSAIPLGDSTMNKLKSYIKGLIGSEELELKNIVDPTIIGGMVIKHEDRLLDLSVAKELREIRKELIYN